MTRLTQWAPWLAALLALAYFSLFVRAPRPAPGEPDLHAFGAIPVVDGGRIKPLDTVARTSLMVISGKQRLLDRPFGDKEASHLPAIRWLIDVMSQDSPLEGPGAQHQVFRIDNEQLLSLLQLEPRPQFLRYSLAEIEKHYAQLMKELARVQEIDPKQRDLFAQKIFELGRHLSVYERIVRRQTPLVVPPQSADADWQSLKEVDAEILGGRATALRQQIFDAMQDKLQKDGIDPEKLSAAQRQQLIQIMTRAYELRVKEMVESERPKASPAGAAFAKLLDLYRAGHAAEFDAAVADFQNRYLDHVPETDLRRARFETFFNRFNPFTHCLALYIGALSLGVLSWMIWPRLLGRAAVGFLVVALAAHTFALVSRMVIQGRPPVTNLYSSAVFIGWGCVILGLILEAIYRNGIGIVLAGLTGWLSLLIADGLGTSGDTLEMMQAVLDTNFWLATHVTVVTLGYTATYVAALLGAIFLLRGLLTPTLHPQGIRTLTQMTYGVICFATLLSFVGTVLGGIWADQSWGRFWGWDPKENGALMIVIWTAMILHARWAGMIKARGIAVLAVLGGIITTWSWFGTNQLGIGLHSYGFRSDMVFWITTSSFAFLGIALLGLLPTRFWRSAAAMGAR